MSKKSRRRAPSPSGAVQTTPPDVQTPTPPVVQPEPAAPVRVLIDVTPEPVSEAALRNLMRDWRRGRATRHLWDMIQDGYVAVLATVMIGAMLVSMVIARQRRRVRLYVRQLPVALVRCCPGPRSAAYSRSR